MSRNKSFSAFLREIGDSTKSSGMSSMGSIVRLTWLRMPIKRSKFSLSWNAFWFQARERNHGPWSTLWTPQNESQTYMIDLKSGRWKYQLEIIPRFISPNVDPNPWKIAKIWKMYSTNVYRISYKFLSFLFTEFHTSFFETYPIWENKIQKQVHCR